MTVSMIIGVIGLMALTASLTILAHPDRRRANKHFMAGYQAGFLQASRIKGWTR